MPKKWAENPRNKIDGSKRNACRNKNAKTAREPAPVLVFRGNKARYRSRSRSGGNLGGFPGNTGLISRGTEALDRAPRIAPVSGIVEGAR